MAEPAEYLMATEEAAAMQVPAQLGVLRSQHIWIGDTGASNHCTFSNLGFTNISSIDSTTVSAHGKSMKSKYAGNIMVEASDKFGNTQGVFQLQGVQYNPHYNFNLFSISKCMRQGWTVTGNASGMVLTSPDKKSKLVFDIVIPTPKGCIFASLLIRKQDIAAAEVGVEGGIGQSTSNVHTQSENGETQRKRTPNKLTLHEVHAKLGHPDKEKARRTAKALGWTMVDGTMESCESCAMGKAKQKNVPQKSTRIKPRQQERDNFMIYPP